MLDMFQILEAFDKYRGSVEKVGKAIKEHSANTLLDLMRFYEIVIFCYITEIMICISKIFRSY